MEVVKHLMYVKPIEKPVKLDPFKHIIFLIDSDNLIERIIPDLDERFIDCDYTNVHKLKEGTTVGYFERVNEINPQGETYFVEVVENNDKENRCSTAFLTCSKCITGSSAIEDHLVHSYTKPAKVLQK